jgi:hypothetical protein
MGTAKQGPVGSQQIVLNLSLWWCSLYCTSCHLCAVSSGMQRMQLDQTVLTSVLISLHALANSVYKEQDQKVTFRESALVARFVFV